MRNNNQKNGNTLDWDELRDRVVGTIRFFLVDEVMYHGLDISVRGMEKLKI